MSDELELTDEELTAFLDREAPPARAAEIEARLLRDRALRHRLAALTVDRNAVRDAMDILLAAAPSRPAVLGGEMQPQAAPSEPDAGGDDAAPRKTFSASRTRVAAAAALAAMIALPIGWSAGRYLDPPRPLADWRAYAAAYHALYTPQTLETASAAPAEQRAQIRRAGASVGLALDASATAVAELRFKRAQILGYEGAPIVQLAFVSQSGAPIALCVTRDPAQSAALPASSRREGMAAAQWAEDGYAFLLIGGQDDRLIQQAAAAFRQAL